VFPVWELEGSDKMSALDKLVDLGEWEFMEGQGLFNGDVNILDAAAELAALRARVEELEKVQRKAAIVVAGWEMFHFASNYDLDTLRDTLAALKG
jgi:hypothetical protein